MVALLLEHLAEPPGRAVARAGRDRVVPGMVLDNQELLRAVGVGVLMRAIQEPQKVAVRAVMVGL
jgi:hypothetical protein